MALRCREAARISLATLGGHAGEAERLELEAHLTGCARCDADHAALGLVRSLRATPTPTMSAAAREHVRRAVAAHRVRAVAPQRRLVWPFAAALAGACAMVALGVVAWRAQPYRIVEGDVTVSTLPTRSAAGAQARAWTFHSNNGGRIRVGEATTDLAQRTDVAWTPLDRTLTLANGTVTVDVAHQVGRRFRVRTARFIVEVVGTRFTVELSGVRTQRGLVRILRPDGTQVARLEAGQAWRDEPMGERSAAALVAPSPSDIPATGPLGTSGVKIAVPVSPPASGAITTRAPGTGSSVAKPATASRLAEARHLLSRGDAVSARRLAATLFRQRGDLAVEARVLFAESFLVEGRYADAVDAYRVVARDFPRSEQAETSLFTVAQLEGEHGRPADTRAALRAYVSRYPHGRFAREVGDRLSRLSSAD